MHTSSEGRGLMAALLLIVACATSAVAGCALIREADGWDADHRRVTAQVVRVLRVPVAAARPAPVPGAVAELAWTGRDGRPRTGRTVLPSAHAPGDRVELWVDARETPASGPPPVALVVLVALLGGLSAAGGLWAAGHLARHGRQAWTARRAVAGWEGEWRAIAPRGR
ncbi:hypothetical protein [Microbispora sp. ATCC PTA-5024]|uniref:hypothetical protein n=1 Tax=Microbispora sp. ATCC PTA-5024 TaxID=316330 RepID=UPI0003DBEE65|nr:hypothetical protein [Microbispora sp. ATCC PTA-5024]ETK30526.1 hypothetical protein MPTA5024_39810 [Microbispora sp. ATCC PTA-5024]